MPKLARYLLIWSAEDRRYELRDRSEDTSYPLQEGSEWWLAWLMEHSSFAFQGKQGHLNLLKEARARGSDYWYAYRNQNRHTSKRYAGRTVDLTFPHLEDLARAFTGEVTPSQPEPLLEPKFQPPRLQAALVARERLLTRMNAGLERRLMLLCAPAGSGKTTLTGQWLNKQRTSTQLPPAAWISLDSGDNDPIRFWRYVITACQRFYSGISRVSLAQLLADQSSSFELPSLNTILTPLLNELARDECAGLLVLEDYHLITEARIHETLIFFLDHLPKGIHLVMLTRSEPPFPLARWRARGELCEVQAEDLRFSQEESAHFFQQTQDLLQPAFFSEEILDQINERVEGWAAGLHLLVLTLQRSSRYRGLECALASFAGDQRSLQEYFVTEVLNAQQEPLQNFLLRTSILSRLTGSLCDAVVEQGEGERLLENVERAGLFLESLDGSGKWYRYHALFAEAMRAEARRRLGSEAVRSLYRKSSQWYAQQKMLPEAIEAAFQAQDIGQAAALIEHLLEQISNFIFGTRIFQQGPEFHTLRRWLEQLPETILGTRPLLCLCYAASIMFICFLEERVPSPETMAQVEKILQKAEDGWRCEGNRSRLGQIFAIRAMILRQPGIMGEAVSYARQALELLPAGEIEGRMMSLWLVGMAEMHEGHFTLAREMFLEVRTFYETLGSSGILRANTVWLSGLDYAQGELQQAAESLHRLLAEARAVGDRDDTCDALLGLAQLSYEWNELATAEQQAQEAFELAQQLANYDLQVQATLILAHIELAHSQILAAQRRCVSQLTSLPTAWPQRTRLVREIQVIQARLALAQDDFAALERWWTELAPLAEIPRALRDREALLRVRWLLHQDQPGDALDLLESLLPDAQEGGRNGTVWEIQLLMILAHAALKHLPTAQKQLRELLERMHSAGYVRLFLNEGEPQAALLQSILPTVRGDAQRVALRQLLLAFAQQRAASGDSPFDSPLIEPLSIQEQHVLHLLASGHSNPEIARKQVVSVNTIKAQVQSIYRKLNVTNRVEASEVAHMLKLF
jgi:LuxR family transcriptional regulator, maltose regulon positive regulatory protein